MSDRTSINRRIAIASLGTVVGTLSARELTANESSNADGSRHNLFVRISLDVKNRHASGGVRLTAKGGEFDVQYGIVHQTHRSSDGLERHHASPMRLTPNVFEFRNTLAWDNGHTFELKITGGSTEVEIIGSGYELKDHCYVKKQGKLISANAVATNVFGIEPSKVTILS